MVESVIDVHIPAKSLKMVTTATNFELSDTQIKSGSFAKLWNMVLDFDIF